MQDNVDLIVSKLLDSDDTTVGGGAGSALTAAMAASIVSMVAKLSRKKSVHLTVEEYEHIAAESDQLSQLLQKGCVEDYRAYCGIVEAFKMPKGSEPEKNARRQAVEAAAVHAAEVPRDNGRLAAKVLELGMKLKGNSNPACLSDLMCAIFLSQSAIKDCALNVEANLSMIKDGAVSGSLRNDMLELFLLAVKN